MSEFTDQLLEFGDMALGGMSAFNPVLGGIYSGYKNAQAVKAKKGDIADWENDITSWYNKSVNQNYLDSSAGKAVYNKALENLQDSNKVAENKGAITGATNEANLAAKTVNQKNFSNTLAQLAGQGTGREDQIDARYRYQFNNVMREKLGLHDADIKSAQQMQANSGEGLQSMLQLATMFI